MKNKKRYLIDWNHKVDEVLVNLRKKCKCGHTQVVPYSRKYDHTICHYCGGRLYYDDKKQKEYDEKCKKEMFRLRMNKSLKEATEKQKREKQIKKMVDKKKLKRKYFKTNLDYFNFCKNMTIEIYIVNKTDSGNIVVYYGNKLGRHVINDSTKKRNIKKRQKQIIYAKKNSR